MVNGPIDREELSRYTLTVKAEDPGGLSAVTRVHIRVIDINDKNPEFVDLPYSFTVKENDLTGYVGRVQVTWFIILFILNWSVWFISFDIGQRWRYRS